MKHKYSLLALAVLAICADASAQTYELRAPLKTLVVAGSPPPSTGNSNSTGQTSPNAPAPVYSAQLSTQGLDFGGVATGQSGVQSFGVLNLGNQPLSLGAITVSDAAFSAATACAASLAPGAQCPVQITFRPTAGQAYSGSVSVNANINNSPLVVTLTGTGLQALAVLTADASKDFGQVYIGQHASRSFTLTNNGNTAATNVAATVAGSTGLTLTANTCGTPAAPTSVQIGGTCQVTVTYAPTATETLNNAALSVASSAAGSPTALVLTGSSAPVPTYSASVSTSALDFGGIALNQSSQKSFSVLNTGNQPLTLGAVQVSNPAYTASTSCGSTLAPNGQCLVQVNFQPTAAQAYPGSVSVSANVSNSPLAVSLSGTGLQAVAALAANTTNAFGQLTVGQSASLTFTLTNSGNTPATNVATTLVGPSSLALSSNTCGTTAAPGTVAGGSTCTMTVTYTPTTTETLSNVTLSVASSAVNSPASTSITGSAVVPTDPYWANVSYLMHMDGANGSTTFTEQKGNSVVRYGSPTITTAASKFGGASATWGGAVGNALSLPAFSPSGSYTIEAWVYIGSSTPSGALLDAGGIANVNWQPQSIYYGWPAAGKLTWLASSANNGTNISAGGTCTQPCSDYLTIGTPVLNAWNHFAVVRDASAGKYYLYLNGTRTVTLSSTLTPFTSAYRVYLGNYPSGSATNFPGASFSGYMDDVRLTNGVARYTGATYTVPTYAFPNQ